MSLTITLELSPTLESEVRQGMKQRNTEQVRYLLGDALLPSIEELLEEESQSLMADKAWEALAEQLIEELATSLPANTAPLSDYAVSRAGIYEEHA